MIVALAATQMEMEPFLVAAGGQAREWAVLVTGVGPLETAVRFGRFLDSSAARITGVLQFGVGGAYLAADSTVSPLGLLDVCLADSEVLGDFGICTPNGMDYFSEDLGGTTVYPLLSPLGERAGRILHDHGISYHVGNFVTVNAVSATAARGRMLRDRWQGICENMEGAAAARLCREYGLPLVELRVISNLVEARNLANWQLPGACARAGELAALLMRELA